MAAPAEAGHHFGSILLGQRGGVSQGSLKLTPNGFLWRRNGGGKPVEIKKADIETIHWTRVPRGCQLGVRVKDGITTNFIGFREKDLEALKGFCQQQYGKDVRDLPLSTSGRNWGGVAVNGRSLMFMVDGKMAFEVPLPDVAQAQQVKDDVMMEFHVDDGASDEREDTLVELALHVPPQHTQWKVEGTEDPPAKGLLDAIVHFTDTGAASADAAVATFSDVHILAPRGRMEVEMNLNQLQLNGQAQEFKIRYTSIQRIFILPKSATPHTLVVISLDPPIRKGQTYYTHILCQFPTDEDASIDLDISPEALAAKNEKCGGKLEASMSGPLYEVFARALRGLSAAKITRPGSFKNAAGDGHAVRCSYKADDGYLYPLDRAFFYVHKPPMLLPFDDVESVELTRLGGNTVSSKTFDLVVRMKNDQEHQFRGIQRSEWQVLLDFFQAKKVRVERLREAQAGPTSGAAAMRALDEEEGGLRFGDEDEDDEDFDVAADSASEQDSEDISDDGDVEMVEEEGISVKAVMKAGSKKSKEGKESSKRPAEDMDNGKDEEEAPAAKEKPAKKPKGEPKPKASKKDKGGEEEGEGKKRKKKDPNAPKGATSAFMYFSVAMREKVKAENPEAKFAELSKLIGEKWKAATPEDKAPFEEKAKVDKERYKREMEAYKAKSGSAAAADAGDGAEEEDV